MNARVAQNLSPKSTDEGKTNSSKAVVHVQKYSGTEKQVKKLIFVGALKTHRPIIAKFLKSLI